MGAASCYSTYLLTSHVDNLFPLSHENREERFTASRTAQWGKRSLFNKQRIVKNRTETFGTWHMPTPYTWSVGIRRIFLRQHVVYLESRVSPLHKSYCCISRPFPNLATLQDDLGSLPSIFVSYVRDQKLLKPNDPLDGSEQSSVLRPQRRAHEGKVRLTDSMLWSKRGAFRIKNA